MNVSVTAGSTCSLLNSDPLHHSCQNRRCRRESGREELSQGSGVLIITLGCYLSLTLLLLHVEQELWCSISHWLSALLHQKGFRKSWTNHALRGTNCFRSLSGLINEILFCGKCLITVSLKIASYLTGHQTCICTSTGKWNLSYTWPERTGWRANSSTSFWHFDIVEIYKVLGCLVYSHQEVQQSRYGLIAETRIDS